MKEITWQAYTPPDPTQSLGQNYFQWHLSLIDSDNEDYERWNRKYL